MFVGERFLSSVLFLLLLLGSELHVLRSSALFMMCSGSCGINCGPAALCWPATTIGLYDCLNVPFFVRCASLGPDNGFILHRFSVKACSVTMAPLPCHTLPPVWPGIALVLAVGTAGLRQPLLATPKDPTSHFEDCCFVTVPENLSAC